MFLRIWIGSAATLLLLLLPHAAGAQAPAPQSVVRVDKTLVEFEILMPKIGNPLLAQQWGPVFEQIGVGVRFRERILDDKPSVEERSRGTYRMVTVVGEMDRDGTLHFPNRSFRRDQSQRLAEWVRELQTYGAQGSPDGQPLWGLSQRQFDALFAALGRPVTADVQGLGLREAIQNLGLPNEYPFRLHRSAEDLLSSSAADHAVRNDVTGLSCGTSLAIVLADFGLGFRPLRTPAGSIELVAEPLQGLSHPWPVGWPVDPKRPRNETAPALFAKVEAGFNEVPLADVLAAIANASQTPVILDYEACARHKVDPTTVNVSYPQKQTAWILILRTVTAQARLTREIMLDEAGNAFVHVFPFEPRRAAERAR